MTRRFASFSLLLALTLLLHLPAAAQAAPAEQTKAMRAVIESQLAAFAADDAARAFSYAAPAIRHMFGTPDRFMAMVRTGYPVVYRPATVTFLAPQLLDGQWIQGVHMTDASGVLWLAVYRLERQADQSWRISGCEVRPASGKIT
ncbi:MAG TPA: DUF4864 domain-containing protein [Caldimonas sp.]|jgi:hypothetical protein|nr:DUF4864 domain-containing protein [Caldimonas sp.]HEX2542329.1 DUF4864 domain-containing protein [Caldimonas sp.]